MLKIVKKLFLNFDRIYDINNHFFQISLIVNKLQDVQILESVTVQTNSTQKKTNH